jgi:acyl-CoA reductase-like NAD-dependent aldehyde dehydrogenase
MNQPLPSLNAWSELDVRDRIARICKLRHLLADNPQPFVDAIQAPFRRSPVETLGSEIIPLADACKFLEQNAVRLLRPKHLGLRGRPLWLWGVRSQIHRQPLGRILIIAPGNYPLMLAGIQTIQALVAGNGVLLKPAPGAGPVLSLLAQTLHSCGVPDAALIILDESPEAAKPYYEQVDKVILTGSTTSGRAVANDLAQYVKPAVMELSGCDAAIVLPGADIKLAASCVRFGLWFNGSNSCIAPRRLLVHASAADALVAELVTLLKAVPPLSISPALASRIAEIGNEAIADGAQLVSGEMPRHQSTSPLLFDHAKPCMRLQREDIGAPVASIVRVNTVADIHAASQLCPFRLGASIFGPVDRAQRLARHLNVGTIVINDLMAPTADPRLPFGGGGASGFGSTRGAEGLLEMTRPKTIQISRGSPRFHLQMENPSTADLVRGQLRMSHAAGWMRRLAGLKQLGFSARASRRGSHS